MILLGPGSASPRHLVYAMEEVIRRLFFFVLIQPVLIRDNGVVDAKRGVSKVHIGNDVGFRRILDILSGRNGSVGLRFATCKRLNVMSVRTLKRLHRSGCLRQGCFRGL